MSIERRRHPRLRFALPLDLSSEHHLFAARTADISEGGVFIKTSASIALGAEVRLKLRLSSRVVIQVNGVVVWQLSNDDGERVGVGIAFQAPSPFAVRSIRRFIRDHAPEMFAKGPARVSRPPRPEQDRDGSRPVRPAHAPPTTHPIG